MKFCPECKSIMVKINVYSTSLFRSKSVWRCLHCGKEVEA